MKPYYLISIFCGLFPMLLGILIFISWILFHSGWLQTVGLLNIYLGLMLFCIGIILLIIYFFKARSKNVNGYRTRFFFSILILLANFPVALAMINHVNSENSKSSLVIVNMSQYAMEDIFLVNRDKKYKFGIISTVGIIKQKIYFEREGSVKYSFNVNNKEYSGILIGYVTHGLTVSAKITFTDSKKVIVNSKI